MAIKGTQPPLGATDEGSRPADYALGSPQSRAAARAMIVDQIAQRNTLTIVMGNNIPGVKITEPNIPSGGKARTGDYIARHIFPQE